MIPVSHCPNIRVWDNGTLAKLLMCVGRIEMPSRDIRSAVQPRSKRGPCRFTQSDVTRAIRAALAANLEIAAVRINPDGSILIIPGTPIAVPPSEANPWDA